MIWSAVFEEARLLKVIIDALARIFDEGVITIREDGLELSSIDVRHIVYAMLGIGA